MRQGMSLAELMKKSEMPSKYSSPGAAHMAVSVNQFLDLVRRIEQLEQVVLKQDEKFQQIADILESLMKSDDVPDTKQQSLLDIVKGFKL